MGVEDGQLVEVHVGEKGAEGRGLTFSHVLIRVGARAFTEMHIDTDEANAAGIRVDGEGSLTETHAARTVGRH
jgi:propanediol utilization protein